MSHLDEGILHAVLDGEVPSTELTEIQRHLGSCRECQTKMDEARALKTEAFDLVEALDQPSLTLAPNAPAITIAAASLPARRRPWVPAAWAASLVGALALGYAVRGAAPAKPDATPTALASADREQNEPTLGDSAPAPILKDEFRPSTRSTQATARPASPEGAGRAKPRQAAEVPAAPVAANSTAPAPSAKGEALAAGEITTTAGAEADRSLAKTAAPAPVDEERKESAKPAELRAGLRADRRLRAAEPSSGGAAASKLNEDLIRLDRPAPPNPADQRTRTVSAVTAIRALGGSLRLIDGLTPSRFEQIGEVIRVVYRTEYGVVALEQWRVGELLTHELVTPTGTPQDSIVAWERRVR